MTDWISNHLEPIDWNAIERDLPYVQDMRACVQDPVFHAEGDVWTHTRMVVDALISDPEFQVLDPDRRTALLVAALFHDVAKPRTREEEHDPHLGRLRVTHRGHSLKGANMAWRHLWREGVAREIRTTAHALIAWHQRVFHVLSRDDPRFEIIRFSTLGRWRELLILARADNLGRICPNAKDTEETLELTRMLADELGCLDDPWPFPSDEARIKFMRNPDASPFYAPMPASGSHVVVLTGLPGSGKDTHVTRTLGDMPMISLDDVRADMGLKHGDNDGAAINEAYERARVHLRAKRPFVWNSTSLTKLMRDKIIDLCLAYDARVELHAVERPLDIIVARDRQRKQTVGRDGIERMAERWEPPTGNEAHGLHWV